MNKIRFTSAAALALLLVSSAASAQLSQSSYFLDNCSFGYRVNPSIQSEKSFFSIGLGNISASLSSNLGITSFVFPTADGRLVTGLNSAISSEQFLGSLQDINSINAGLNMNLLSIGIRDSLSFYNFEVNARMLGNASLPKDLFAFLKDGSRDSAYDLSSLGAGVQSFVEASFGYSRQFGKLTAGARAKLLLGLENVNLDVINAKIYANGSQIGYDIDASIRSAASFLEWGTREGTSDILEFSEMNFIGNFGVSGVGAAIDLGASYEPVDGLTVTAGLNDLGFIKWKYNMVARTAGDYSFKGVENIDVEGGSSIGDELDAAFEDLKTLADFHMSKDGESESESLGVTLNAGARYRFPFYRRLSAGALYTQRFWKGGNWLDARLGATVSPLNWFSLTGSYGITNFGKTMGAALSLTFAGINLYAGLDCYSGRISKVPVDMSNGSRSFNIPVPVDPFNFNLNFGINITVGKRHTHYFGHSRVAPVPAAEPVPSAAPAAEAEPAPVQETSPESIAAAAAQSAS